MIKILGISAFYHDSAASLIVDGEIIAAAQEERFTRVKHTPDFPENAIRYCLDEAGFEIDELDCIVFYDKPFLKFERLLETYYGFSPVGLASFLKAIPVWINEKIFLKKLIFDELIKIGNYDKRNVRLLFSEHHLSHAASAFFPSPFQKAAIITVDGVGEWSTASIGVGENNAISIRKEMHFPHSIGLLYSSFTFFLGFKVNSGEYKVMGLAPYGNPKSQQTLFFIEQIKKHLIDIKMDGSVWLNQEYFNYATGLKMIKEKKWNKLFGFERRDEEAKIKQHHCDLALAIQLITEEIIIKLAKETKEITGINNLCLAGGVALNCVANGKLQEHKIFENIYIQPAAGDAGGALGAALSAYYMYYDKDRICDAKRDSMNGSYLGPEYSEKEIMQMNKRVKAIYSKYASFEELAKKVAAYIAEGKVTGWFQGRMEFGPRALGNRSILGDPRNPEMQKKLNLKIKYREGFRPFAPSVLREDAHEYFDMDSDSPYMLLISSVKQERRNPLPEDYFDMPLWERLYFKRSDIQSITHIDFSARIQTVHRETNPRFWKLITAFKGITGYGLVVNTSFNVRGEPIVCTPFDAYRCFMSTEMDYLVINDFLYCKTKQPDFENKSKWKVTFKKD